ncbi:MAG: SOS response-associated peptidase [Candidatus Kapaibacterium sp.]|nr:MAG: SOS response-associated peptidase [Candidatus Kapabacteria bacterium]
MCGRYTMFMKPEEIKRRFKAQMSPDVLEKLRQPRYNLAPTQDIPTITKSLSASADNASTDAALTQECTMMRWGLIPSWANDASIGAKLINARAETLLEKPSFRNAVRSRRCLILANGFYEWHALSPKHKQPMYVRLRSNAPFALAGLWDDWNNPETQATVRSCSIITTTPNAVLAQFHHRMAVILSPNDEAAWLDESLPIADVMRLLHPYPAEEMEAFPVSERVNSFRDDDAGLIEKVEPLRFDTPKIHPADAQQSLF